MRKLLSTALLLLATSSILQAQSPWIYSTYFGGLGIESVQAVAPDPLSGNLYVAGLTTNTGPPFTGPAGGSAYSAYLATFDPGGHLLSSQLFADTASFRGMHVDEQGQVYLALGAVTTGAGRVVKVAHDGTIVFSITAPGSIGASPHAITSDSNGNVLFCGFGSAATIPVTDGAYKACGSDTSQFCSKLSSDGSQLLASTMFGPYFIPGRDNSRPTALTTDSSGDFILLERLHCRHSRFLADTRAWTAAGIYIEWRRVKTPGPLSMTAA